MRAPRSGGTPVARARGWINIRRADHAPDPKLQDVQALIGDGTPKISAGGGGWQAVARDGRVASQWWNGRDAPAVTLPIVLIADQEAEAAGNLPSVPDRVRALETFWGVRLGEAEEPPPLRFDSRGLVPLDFQDQGLWLWTLTALEETDGTIREAEARIFATFTITLQRLVDDDIIVSEAAKRRASAYLRTTKLSLNNRHYIVKAGDTLTGIAAREYGDVDRWKDIADHNNLPRSHRHHLRVGERLRLP